MPQRTAAARFNHRRGNYAVGQRIGKRIEEAFKGLPDARHGSA
jgi:hypothetical protein